MKKLVLALIVLGAGVIAFARLNLLANQHRASASQSHVECDRLSGQVNELTASAAELRVQVGAKRTRLNEVSAAATRGPDTPAIQTRDSIPKSGKATPAQLRQRYGIAWDNSPTYVLVSKDAVKRMYLRGIDDKGAFTPTACAILGLTPEERDTIQAALKRAEAEHADWVKTAVQRVEPAGDIVADYRLPANLILAGQILAEAEALQKETFGSDRAGLVRDYAGAWLFGHGNLGRTPMRFTVRRHPEGQQPAFWYMIEAVGGNSASGAVFLGGFPDLFRPLFPGGWPDLAQREGFTLPE